MLVIQDKIVSDDIVEEQFLCDLKACKGACCREGDFGAPLEENELNILTDIYPTVSPYLTDEGRAAIAEQGIYTKNEQVGGWIPHWSTIRHAPT